RNSSKEKHDYSGAGVAAGAAAGAAALPPALPLAPPPLFSTLPRSGSATGSVCSAAGGAAGEGVPVLGTQQQISAGSGSGPVIVGEQKDHLHAAGCDDVPVSSSSSPPAQKDLHVEVNGTSGREQAFCASNALDNGAASGSPPPSSEEGATARRQDPQDRACSSAGGEGQGGEIASPGCVVPAAAAPDAAPVESSAAPCGRTIFVDREMRATSQRASSAPPDSPKDPSRGIKLPFDPCDLGIFGAAAAVHPARRGASASAATQTTDAEGAGQQDDEQGHDGSKKCSSTAGNHVRLHGNQAPPASGGAASCQTTSRLTGEGAASTSSDDVLQHQGTTTSTTVADTNMVHRSGKIEFASSSEASALTDGDNSFDPAGADANNTSQGGGVLFAFRGRENKISDNKIDVASKMLPAPATIEVSTSSHESSQEGAGADGADTKNNARAATSFPDGAERQKTALQDANASSTVPIASTTGDENEPAPGAPPPPFLPDARIIQPVTQSGLTLAQILQRGGTLTKPLWPLSAMIPLKSAAGAPGSGVSSLPLSGTTTTGTFLRPEEDAPPGAGAPPPHKDLLRQGRGGPGKKPEEDDEDPGFVPPVDHQEQATLGEQEEPIRQEEPCKQEQNQNSSSEAATAKGPHTDGNNEQPATSCTTTKSSSSAACTSNSADAGSGGENPQVAGKEGVSSNGCSTTAATSGAVDCDAKGSPTSADLFSSSAAGGQQSEGCSTYFPGEQQKDSSAAQSARAQAGAMAGARAEEVGQKRRWFVPGWSWLQRAGSTSAAAGAAAATAAEAPAGRHGAWDHNAAAAGTTTLAAGTGGDAAVTGPGRETGGAVEHESWYSSTSTGTAGGTAAAAGAPSGTTRRVSDDLALPDSLSPEEERVLVEASAGIKLARAVAPAGHDTPVFVSELLEPGARKDAAAADPTQQKKLLAGGRNEGPSILLSQEPETRSLLPGGGDVEGLATLAPHEDER
ncbi:unnamed protein product, partial [Amoebophrya sp. A120]